MFEEITTLPTSFYRDVQNYDSVESEDNREEEIILPKQNSLIVINACSMKNLYKIVHDNNLASVFLSSATYNFENCTGPLNFQCINREGFFKAQNNQV